MRRKENEIKEYTRSPETKIDPGFFKGKVIRTISRAFHPITVFEVAAIILLSILFFLFIHLLFQ